MGVRLVIDFEDCGWSIHISRTDRKEDNNFFALDQQEISPEQIAEFVPNWENLDWQYTGMEGIAKEAYIEDGDYRLYLICFEETPIDPDMAIQEFSKFMKG